MMEKYKNIPSLRFPEFKDEWEKLILKDVVKVNQGLAILKSNRFSSNGHNRLHYITIPYLEGKVSEYIENAQKSVICFPDDIIITRTGNSVGKIWTNAYGVFHNNFFKVTPLTKSISKSFLYQYLNKIEIQFLMKQYAGTSAIPDLNHGEFYIIPYYKTSLEEQQKIASFLSTVDEKIQQLSRKKELLEQYKKGVMQQLFSGKLRFKDENGNNYQNWVEKRLGEVGETYNGLTGKTKDDFGNGKPYVQYKQIFDNPRIDISKFELVNITPEDKQNKVFFGDVFFTVSSETPNEIGTASVLLDKIEELYLNSFCFGYRPNSLETLYPYFSRYLFRSELFRNDIVKLAQGSTRYNMSKAQLMLIKIKLPCFGEQQKIANFLSSIDAKIESTRQQINQTQSFKKGLLQQLFV